MLGLLILLGTTIFGFFQVIGQFIWGLFYGIYSAVVYFGNLIYSNPDILKAFAITLFIFIFGIFFAIYQSEVQTAVDVTYECSIYPVIQLVESFFYTVMRIPYDWVAKRLNDTILYLRDCLLQAIDDIKAIADLSSIAGIVDLFRIIYNEIKCMLTFITEVPSWHFYWITNALRTLFSTIGCFFDWIGKIIVRLLTFTYFNSYRYLCDKDPTAKCKIRKQVIIGSLITFPPSTCPADPYDPISELMHCIAMVLQMFFPDDPSGFNHDARLKIAQISNDIGCFISLLIDPWFYIAQGIIDDAITGSGCVTLCDLFGTSISGYCSSTQTLVPDALLGIINCISTLLDHISNGQIADFISMIMNYIFAFIQDVIDTVEGFIDCHSQDVVNQCFKRWPIDHDPLLPGYCKFGTSVEPTGGIFQCFALIGTCLKDPAKMPLSQSAGMIAFIDILYGQITKSIDFIVCPFALLGKAFSPQPICAVSPNCDSSLTNGYCSFKYIEDNIPLLSFLGSFIKAIINVINNIYCSLIPPLNAIKTYVQNTIQATYSTLQNTVASIKGILDCLKLCNTFAEFTYSGKFVHCLVGGDPKCSKKRNIIDDLSSYDNIDQYEYSLLDLATKNSINQAWRHALDNTSIPLDTYCGSILYNHGPFELNSTIAWTEYMTYWGCYTLLAVTTVIKKDCPELGDIRSDVLNGRNLMTIVEAYFSVCFRDNSTLSKRYQEENERIAEETGVPVEEIIRKKDEEVESTINVIFESTSNFFRNVSNLLSGNALTYTISTGWEKLVNSQYASLTRQYFYDTRKAKSDYDNALNELANDPNKSEEQKKAEIEVIEQMQNKVLRKMFDSYSNKFWMLNKGKVIETSPDQLALFIAAANNDSSASLSKRGEPSQLQTIQFVNGEVITLEMNNHYLIKHLPRPKTGVFRSRTFITSEEQKKNEEKIEEVRSEFSKRYTELVEETPKIVEAFHILQKRGYDFSSNTVFRMIHMITSVASGGAYTNQRRNGTWTDVVKYVTGDQGYLVEEGFVPLEEQTQNLAKRQVVVPRGSLWDLFVTGNYDSRENRTYLPFLFPNTTNMGANRMPNMTHLIGLLQRTQYRRKINSAIRKLNIATSTERHVNAFDFNFNDEFYKFMDSIGNAITGSTNKFFTTFVSKTEKIWNDFVVGLGDWSDHFVSNLEEFVTCHVPENIDGSHFYNPFCFPLIPDAIYAGILVLPQDSTIFTPQIGWPTELIDRPCVNKYAGGNGMLFTFAFSDNCGVIPCPPESRYTGSLFWPLDKSSCTADPNGCCRPFCDNAVPCDYCARDYRTCADAGFEDALDSLLYILAAVAQLIADIFQSGMSFKLIDQIATFAIVVITSPTFLICLILAVVIVLPSLGLGVPFAFLPFLFTSFIMFALEKTVIWILVHIFTSGTLPWPLIIGVGSILIFILLAYFGVSPPKEVIIVLSVYLGLWFIILIAGLYSDAPIVLENVIDPIGWLISIFTFIRDDPVLGWLMPWSTKLVARLNEFLYPTNVIPFLDTFCFFWTFYNVALLILISLLLPFGAILIFNWGITSILFLIGLGSWGFTLWTNIRNYRLRKSVIEHDSKINRLSSKFDNLKQKYASKLKGFSNRGPIVKNPMAITGNLFGNYDLLEQSNQENAFNNNGILLTRPSAPEQEEHYYSDEDDSSSEDELIRKRNVPKQNKDVVVTTTSKKTTTIQQQQQQQKKKKSIDKKE